VLGAAGPALSMSGYTKLVLWNTIGAFVLNFGLNIFLIPKYGIIGAAIATLISLSILSLARTIEVRIILKMNFINQKLIKPILAGILAFAAGNYLKVFIMPFHTIFTLISGGFIIVIVFFTTLWLLGLDEDDSGLLAGIQIILNNFKSKASDKNGNIN
jgi:O-antigen/teichoic acid export membrane protein